MNVGYKYHDGVLVCAQHHTPVQKNDNGLWCRKCTESRDYQAIVPIGDRAMIITLAKGGTKERKIDVSKIEIADLWHIAMRTDGPDQAMILEVWNLAHDMRRALQELT